MDIKFDVIEDKDNNLKFVTDAEGDDIIHTPLLNKGTAFTKTERDRFRLNGLIPPRILTLGQQMEKIYRRYKELGGALKICSSCNDFDKKNLAVLKKDVDIARYNFLRDLQDRNELLFYAFAYHHMEETIPIIYTPTIGDAVMRYSRDSVRFRGVFLSPFNIDNVESVFDRLRFKRPSIAVVTDNQGILGLGDQNRPLPLGQTEPGHGAGAGDGGEICCRLR